MGIDLTSAEAKPSACLGLDRELQLIYSGFLHQDSDILEPVSGYGFEVVAIDAPISLPRGLCCLEESCSCQPQAGVMGRTCERELARLGIPICTIGVKRSYVVNLRRELSACPFLTGWITLPKIIW